MMRTKKQIQSELARYERELPTLKSKDLQASWRSMIMVLRWVLNEPIRANELFGRKAKEPFREGV